LRSDAPDSAGYPGEGTVILFLGYSAELVQDKRYTGGEAGQQAEQRQSL